MSIETTRTLNIPQAGNRENVLRQNTRAQKILRQERMVPLARREAPPKAIRAIGNVLGAPLVGLAIAGQQIKKVIEKPINAYNARRYRPPLTIQQQVERRRNQRPASVSLSRRTNMSPQKPMTLPKPTFGQRIRSGIGHIINTPKYILGSLAW